MAGGHTIGGDPERYMDPPTQQLGSLSDVMGGASPIAMLLDLVGLHRQVAKGPKNPASDGASPTPTPPASVPQVLTDVSSMLDTPQATPVFPTTQNAPLTTWGQRWIDSMKPIASIDPNSGL